MAEKDTFALEFKFGGNTEFLSRLESLMERVDKSFKSVKIDGKKASEGIDKVGEAAARNSKKLNTLNSSFSSLFSKMKGLAAGYVGFRTIGVGISTFSEMENLETSMEVLLGSAEKSKDFTAYITEFAKRTPYAVSNLASLSKGLIQYNVPAERAKNIMSNLGDIALGNSESMGRLGLVMGQVSAAGRLMGQDMLQFISAGFNPLAEIAKRTGESMSSLKDKMSKGKISFDDVAKSIKNATMEGGRFYKGMEKGSKTLSGLWSTALDNIKMSLAGAISKNQVKIKEFVKKLGEIDFSPMIDGLAKIIELMTPFLKLLGEAIEILASMPNLIQAVTTALFAYKAMSLIGASSTDKLGFSFDRLKSKTIGLNMSLGKMIKSRGAAMGVAAGVFAAVNSEGQSTTGGALQGFAGATATGAATGGAVGAAAGATAYTLGSVVKGLYSTHDERIKRKERRALGNEVRGRYKGLIKKYRQYKEGSISEESYKREFAKVQKFESGVKGVATHNLSKSFLNLGKKKEVPITQNIYNNNSGNITQKVDLKADLAEIGILLNANLRELVESQLNLDRRETIIQEA